MRNAPLTVVVTSDQIQFSFEILLYIQCVETAFRAMRLLVSLLLLSFPLPKL